MTSSAQLVIERHDASTTLELRDDIVAVYAASHDDQTHDPWFHPGPFWDRLVELYLPGRDFEIVVGRIAGQAVGYAFGSPREHNGSVWDDLRTTYPAFDLPIQSAPMYLFREFAVHPEHQRQGIGRQLHDELLRPRPEPAAELLVRKDNLAAQAAYRSWGWVQLGEKQPMPDSPTFDRLVLTLPISRQPSSSQTAGTV